MNPGFERDANARQPVRVIGDFTYGGPRFDAGLAYALNPDHGRQGSFRHALHGMRSSWTGGERFETRDHIEKLLVNAALTQAMEGSVERFQQFVDVLFRTLHGG